MLYIYTYLYKHTHTYSSLFVEVNGWEKSIAECMAHTKEKRKGSEGRKKEEKKETSWRRDSHELRTVLQESL